MVDEAAQAMAEEYPRKLEERCPECNGEGRVVVGCAVSHAVTWPCWACMGTGGKLALPDYIKRGGAGRGDNRTGA
jgi:hypothetical protein